MLPPPLLELAKTGPAPPIARIITQSAAHHPRPACPALSRPPAARSGLARNVRAAASPGVRAGARRRDARPIAPDVASGIPAATRVAAPPAQSSARRRAAAPPRRRDG